MFKSDHDKRLMIATAEKWDVKRAVFFFVFLNVFFIGWMFGMSMMFLRLKHIYEVRISSDHVS